MDTRDRDAAITDQEIARLEQIAQELRALDIASIYASTSGHPGGTLSIIDIETVLYFHTMKHKPGEPDWKNRDRLFWSAGHKAPAMYVALAKAGYFPMEEAMCLRQLGSPCQGHPNWLELPGVEMSSGSLGQGLGVAVGSAIAAKLDVLREHCDRLGTDYDAIAKTVLYSAHVGVDGSGVEEMLAHSEELAALGVTETHLMPHTGDPAAFIRMLGTGPLDRLHQL